VAFIATAGAALIHSIGSPHLRGSALGEAFWDGATAMLKPLTVLLAAWALGSTLKELETARSLSLLLDARLDPRLLPAAVFGCGAAISFFTGTSWGTMGILTPLAVPVAASMGADPSLIAWVVAAVFSGAVFGDHASPLSDTTVVSSIACGVEPWDHVRTQLPYAATTAVLALAAGFIPLGYGLNPWLCLPVGACLLIVIARHFGSPPPSSSCK
jgi:Na+/H+ antiporter NhaC